MPLPKRRKPELKDTILGFKINPSLLFLLDEEAQRRGISRSGVARGILLDHFRQVTKKAV